MRRFALATLLTAPLMVACGAALAQSPAPAPTPAPAPAPEPVATAALKTADGGDAGMVTAFRGPQGLLFRVEGKGWPQGWHGTHLHAVGKCEGPGFTSAGAHVNHAEAHPHGLLNTSGGPDLGDLQNIHAAADGSAHAEVYLGNTTVDLTDADGTSFLVHANADDHVSQPIGGAGGRIACGVFAPVG
jgi:Cu-Zn family superoxide dismutase